MKWTEIENKWGQLGASLQGRWSRLSDGDLFSIKGKRELLAGKLRERYGLALDEAEDDIDDFLASFDEIPEPLNDSKDSAEITRDFSNFETRK